MYGCVCSRTGWIDMDIHGYRDMDIHVIYLVGRIGRVIFLFGSMDMYWTRRAIFLFGWMNKDGQGRCSHHLLKLVMLPLQTCTTAATHVQNT